jgi:hypothetical protein
MLADLIVVTNGRRDCIGRSLPDIDEAFPGFVWNHKIISDDSPADEQYDFEQWIEDDVIKFNDLAGWEIIHTTGATGFDGAYRQVWSIGRATRSEFVFVVEDDFLFNGTVPIHDMQWILNLRPCLAQVALLRQPWNEHEKAAGGIVEMHPDWYQERLATLHSNGHNLGWLEHTVCFTTNPFLARTEVMQRGPDWPTGPDSEGRFGFDIRREGFGSIDGEDVRFSYLGRKGDAPRVNHIGHVRTGSNY